MDPEPMMELIVPGLYRFGPIYLREGEPHASVICEVVRRNPGADRMQLADLVNLAVRERTGDGLHHDDILVKKWVGPAFARTGS